MTSTANEPERHDAGDALTRRTLIRRAGAVGALAVAGPLIAACGSSSNATSSGAVRTTATASSAIGKQIQSILGTPTGKAAGQGLTIQAGDVTALTGSGAVYGTDDRQGLALAAAHITAAGGPNFKFTFEDNGTGNAQDGVEATRRLGIAGTPLCLSSYAADLGAMLPGIKEYKMLTFDGGGGNAFGTEPYFYGTRTSTYVNQIAGVMAYIKKAFPDARNVSNLVWDRGSTVNALEAKLYNQSAKANGLTPAAPILTQIGQTDYTNELATITQEKPDAIVLGIFTEDPAYFMKQYITSGLKVPVICAGDFVPQALQIAGSAFTGYHFAFDYFDANAPENNWAKLFVQQYEKQFGQPPIYHSANVYEDAFLLWQLVRGAIAKNLDTSKGTSYLEVFEAAPSFKSLYGGSGNTPGVTEISLTTNSVSKRAQGVYAVTGTTQSSIKRLATFDVGGANFKMA